MDFISAFGNLRARNYAIDEIDKFQAKLKAGRIIPAIATATAMATGFVLLELYKEVAGKPLDRRRNLFANLALPGPLLSLSEPMACAKIKSGQRWDPDMYMDVDEVAYPEGHSLWDQIPVPGAASMTLEALRSWFTTHHQLVLTELTLMHGARARARALAPFLLERSRPAHLPASGSKSVSVFSSSRSIGDADANLATPLPQLIASKTGADTSKMAFYELSGAIFQTVEGDDATVATIVLQFD